MGWVFGVGMAGYGAELEAPQSADGPLLSSATSALKELVVSLSSASADMESRTAEAQADITAQLGGAREAASNAFSDASEIANFFEQECHALQQRLLKEATLRADAERSSTQLAEESRALSSHLQTCLEEKESHAAQLQGAREELSKLRLEVESGNVLKQENAALQDKYDAVLQERDQSTVTHTEKVEDLKTQVAQLQDKIADQAQAIDADTSDDAQMQEEINKCIASANKSAEKVKKMEQELRKCEEQKDRAEAQVDSLRREMASEKANHIAELEAERARILRSVDPSFDSSPERMGSGTDDADTADTAAQLVAAEIEIMRAEYEEKLASLRREADGLRLERDRKHKTLLATHSTVKNLQEQHDLMQQSTVRDADQVADLTRENEWLKKQLELSHQQVQLQLSMQGSPVPFPQGPEQSQIVELENELSRRDDEHAKMLEIERSHAAELEAHSETRKKALKLERTVEVLNQTLADLQAKHKGDIAALNQANRDTRDKAFDLERTVASKNETLAHMQAEQDDIRQQLEEKKDELATAKAAHAESQERHAMQVQEHAEREKQLREDADLLATEKATQQRAIADADRGLQDIRQRMVEDGHKHETAIKTLQAAADQQVGEWQRKHEDIQQECKNLEARLQITEGELRTEKDAHAQTTVETDRISSERHKIRCQHDDLNDKYEVVLQERDQSRAQHAEAAEAHRAAESRLHDLRVTHEELSTEHERARNEVTELGAHRHALTSQLETAMQKAKDAHQDHEDAKLQHDSDIKTMQDSIRSSHLDNETLQEDLDAWRTLQANSHEELVQAKTEISRSEKEFHDEKQAHGQTKERAAVELAESKRAWEKQLGDTRNEYTQHLAEMKKESEEGYAALRDQYEEQLALVDKVKEEHARIQARWENEVKEQESVNEKSVAKYGVALEDAERYNREAQAMKDQHSLLIQNHTEGLEEVEQLRLDLEAMSKEFTQAQDSHAKAKAALDELRAENAQLCEAHMRELESAKDELCAEKAQLSEAHMRELESAKDKANVAKDAELAVHRQRSEQATNKLRSEFETATAELRDAYELQLVDYTAQKVSEEALNAAQLRSQVLADQVETYQAEVEAHQSEVEACKVAEVDAHQAGKRKHEELQGKLDEMEGQLAVHQLQLGTAEDSHQAEVDELRTAHSEASAASEQKLQQAHDKCEEALAQVATKEAEAQRLQTELSAANANLADVRAESEENLRSEAERREVVDSELRAAETNLATLRAENENDRRNNMDQLEKSLAVAHDSVQRLERERAQQAQLIESKEQQIEKKELELTEWRGKALNGENVLLRSASQALALSEEVSSVAPRPDVQAAESGFKGSPTGSVAASAASARSRPRRGSWVSDAGQVMYECELGTGFRGTLEEVKDHEDRIRKMREETKRDLAMPRSFSSSSFPVPSVAAATAAPVSAPDPRYAQRMTSSRPMASPVLADSATYSSSSRYAGEDVYARRTSSAAARSTELSLSDDKDIPRGGSRADALASKAAARKQRWASAGTTSRAPRREPGVAPVSEGEPHAAY